MYIVTENGVAFAEGEASHNLFHYHSAKTLCGDCPIQGVAYSGEWFDTTEDAYPVYKAQLERHVVLLATKLADGRARLAEI